MSEQPSELQEAETDSDEKLQEEQPDVKVEPSKVQEALDLDPWQKDVLSTPGNVTIRAGRQVGKSTVVAKKAHDFAKANPGTTTLVIASSQRQATYLFMKIRALFDVENGDAIEKAVQDYLRASKKKYLSREHRANIEAKASIYEGQPTLSRMTLKTGSVIYCLPTGKTGIFVRGYSIDLLIADEAAYIPASVWVAVRPMLAVSKRLRGFGYIILLSTPFGKGGFFYDSHSDPDFRQFHVSSEDCPRIDKKFLLKEKSRLTKIEYAQEYLGEFVDEWHQYFESRLVERCATFINWSTDTNYDKSKGYYLGVDFARYGEDSNAFVIAEMDGRGHLKIVKALTTQKVNLMATCGEIVTLDKIMHFKRIFVDSSGLGGGAADRLRELLGRKIVDIDNATKSVDCDEKRKKIFKEDLYSSALVMMEQGKLEMIADLPLMRSLKKITWEYTSAGNLVIYGKDAHLAEAFVRACWSTQAKGLRLFLY